MAIDKVIGPIEVGSEFDDQDDLLFEIPREESSAFAYLSVEQATILHEHLGNVLAAALIKED